MRRGDAAEPVARLTGLPPLAAADARVLVLGSMPGAASLAAQRYYAHPRNRFWPFIGAVIGVDLVALDYAERVDRLRRARIAVWDVLAHCERPGSLDADIVRGSEVANDFPAFFAAHPLLRAVFLNGGSAARAFARHALPRLGEAYPHLAVTALPSTSPANASQTPASKLKAWMQVADALRAGPSLDGAGAETGTTR